MNSPTLFANKAKVASADGVAPICAGIPAYLTSNVSRGAGGSSGSGNGTAATNGTQRAFTETQLKTVAQLMWSNGGNPDCIYVGGYNKQVLSSFTGNATRFNKAETKELNAAIDVYQSDFGSLSVKPARHIAPRDCLMLDHNYLALAELRPMFKEKIPKTGDSQAYMLLSEYTLEVRNEKALGHIADLTTN